MEIHFSTDVIVEFSGEVCHHMYKHVCLKLYTIGVETEEENIDKCEKYMYNRC